MSESNKGLETGTNRWLEALEWHTQLREANEGALTSGILREWQQWYAQPDNQRVFDRLTRLVDHGLDYRAHTPSAAELEVDQYDPSLSITEWRQADRVESLPQGGHRRKSRWTRGASIIGAAAAALVGLLILRPSWRPFEGGTSQVTYQTPVGKLTQVNLADGSDVTLGGDTKLTVRYTAHRRSIQLFHGEAWFKDKDFPDWPFIVTAGDRTITALGTAFVVNRDADRVVVMVTAGTVAVSTRPHAPFGHPVEDVAMSKVPLAAIRLNPDQELTYRDDGTVGPVTPANPQAATAWTKGLLVFDQVPLRYVLGNVDRYWSRHIEASPRAGALKFSGLVYENQIEDWLNGLSRIFPVAVEKAGPNICVHMTNPHSPSSDADCAGPE